MGTRISSFFATNLIGFCALSVQNSSTIVTDGWAGRQVLEALDYRHLIKPPDGLIALPGVQKIVDQLKIGSSTFQASPSRLPRLA
ncbi:MAG: hypothetical protein LBS60_01405 [Deltaproteobacteria bacterium]|nr:hypothetical protein [Deltaproteobacteria bacterium]